MKKYLFLTVLICIGRVPLSMAQSFSIPSSNYSYWGDLTANLAEIYIPVTNTTNTDIDILVAKTQNNLAAAHSSHFCFINSCFDSTYNITPATIIFPGHSIKDLSAGLHKNGAYGVSYVSYRIYDSNNTNDFADVSIEYHITTTGIQQTNSLSTISAPQPNPADNFCMVSYYLNRNYRNHKIEILDLFGNKVFQINLSNASGSLFLPVNELASGVYFYSLLEDNKVLVTNKLVVAHKN